MIRLNIGSGPNLFPGWINYDRVDQAGYVENIRRAPSFQGWPQHQIDLAIKVREQEVETRVRDLREGFPMHPDGSVDAIYLGQVIEHLNILTEVPKLLAECYRMLRVGGMVRITTPDLELLISHYNRNRMDEFASEQPAFYKNAWKGAQLCFLMFGASGPDCTWDNYEGHFFIFDRESMYGCLTEAGFNVTSISREPTLTDVFADVVDQGMSHSLAAEAMKVT